MDAEEARGQEPGSKKMALGGRKSLKCQDEQHHFFTYFSFKFWVMKKMMLCLCLLVLTLASCGWSADYKQTVKDTITTRLKLNMPNAAGTKQQKAELCDCMVKVFEKTYPGKLPAEGIPKDTLRKAFYHCCPWIPKM